MDKKEIFLKAIHEKKLVKIKYKSKEKGTIERECVPFDFGPSNRLHDGIDRYHLYSLTSPRGPHVISIVPAQLISISTLDKEFEPGDYVHWAPQWHVKRDWGIYSGE